MRGPGNEVEGADKFDSDHCWNMVYHYGYPVLILRTSNAKS